MFLSFVTAAALLLVQGWDWANRHTRVDENQPLLSGTTAQSGEARLGIKEISSAFHPVALIRRSRLVVDLSDRQVTLYQDDAVPLTYEIAVGREGWETPSGKFSILSMQRHPVWQNPISGEVVAASAENPLGSRWIGFWTDGTHQIGFHGTNQDDLIGQAVSHGCIRMRDAEIQALFTQVAVGTPVVVQP